MRSLITRYSMYFNKKHARVGHIFQGRYKAILIDNDRYLLHLSRYIHLNPSEYTADLTKAYSSYPEYLGLRKSDWIKPDIILNFFNNPTIPELTKINSYKSFIEEYKKDSAIVLRELTLE
jgi:putative transposase